MNADLAQLELGYNPIGADGAKALAEVLKFHGNINTLKLGWCQVIEFHYMAYVLNCNMIFLINVFLMVKNKLLAELLADELITLTEPIPKCNLLPPSVFLLTLQVKYTWHLDWTCTPVDFPFET